MKSFNEFKDRFTKEFKFLKDIDNFMEEYVKIKLKISTLSSSKRKKFIQYIEAQKLSNPDIMKTIIEFDEMIENNFNELSNHFKNEIRKRRL